MIALGMNSPGGALHDEVTHYLIARDSWSDPIRILDVWGRPGNTLFYLLPSVISLGARRWWALATCIIITFIATRSAARLGLRHLWLIPLALYLQPWYMQLGFNSITQIPFMLALAIAIDQWIAKRYDLASLMFGLLPIIRHEGLALTAIWLVYCFTTVLTRKHAGSARVRLTRLTVLWTIALLPMIGWNAVHYAVYGRFASGNLIDVRPTDIYGSGDWLHFVGPTVTNVGFAISVFAMLGTASLWHKQRGTLVYALPALLYFAVHTLIYRFGLFASGGYVLFLLPMAPTFAVLAAFGAERLPDWIDRIAGNWLKGNARRSAKLITVGALFGAAILHIGFATLAVQPWPLAPNEVAAEEAAAWLIANRYDTTPVYSSHVWFFWVYESRGELVEIPGGTKLTTEQVPEGALVLWDANYGDLNGIELSVLRGPNSGFIEIKRFYADQMILFRKL